VKHLAGFRLANGWPGLYRATTEFEAAQWHEGLDVGLAMRRLWVKDEAV